MNVESDLSGRQEAKSSFHPYSYSCDHQVLEESQRACGHCAQDRCHRHTHPTGVKSSLLDHSWVMRWSRKGEVVFPGVEAALRPKMREG